MRLSLRSLLAPSLALSLSLSAPVVYGQDNTNVTPEQQHSQNWQMFAHYVNVARPQQAIPYAERLVGLSNADFLAAVESDRHHTMANLAPWANNDTLGPTWQQLEDKYQEALIERSRDVVQMRQNIQDLGDGRTAEYNAINRLRTSGQFAAPYYLEVLQDSTQRDLHPRVINAMVNIGSELTYPLSIALPNLDPATQLNVVQTISRIGYPEALPYLKVMAQSSDTSERVKAACAAAFDQIAVNAPFDTTGTAAELFVRIGQLKYAAGTRNEDILGMDLANANGIIWRYDTSAGLIPVPVALNVFADSLAMQNAAAALTLDAEMTAAVTLHLASNLRRENRLAGAPDPGYRLSNPASFYLLLAGAPQQKAVLTQALSDNDADLSLDAIQAMANTVGDNVLLGSDDSRAPVLDALYYADRRVRYTAAITLANAAPTETYPGAASVVPVLSQALRQSDQLNAMVIAPGGADVLTAAMENVDYNAVGDTNVGLAMVKASAAMPGVDLIVYTGDYAGFEATYNAIKSEGSLSVTPILALVGEGVAAAIDLNYPGVMIASPITDATNDDELDRLDTLSGQTIETYGGTPITDAQALAYAETAAALLRSIAGHDSIYNASDAEPILIEALDDDRSTVAIGAAQVLELLDSDTAQQGLAFAASQRVGSVQIAILNALAESAKAYGSRLDRDQTDALIQLVNDSTGETAIAAARALGALTERPTSDTTGFILGE